MLVKDPIKKPYYDSNGNEVPSVTEILSLLAKPAIVRWAWKMGFQHKNMDSARESAVDIGNLAHYYSDCRAKGVDPQIGDGYKHKDIKKALQLTELFNQYFEQRKAKLIASELAIVDDDLGVGGTIDMVVETDSGLEIWDRKTSGAIWPEYIIQVVAYWQLYQRFTTLWAEPRIVLTTKRGWFEAPDISKEKQSMAFYCWSHLRDLYHPIKELRELHNAGSGVEAGQVRADAALV